MGSVHEFSQLRDSVSGRWCRQREFLPLDDKAMERELLRHSTKSDEVRAFLEDLEREHTRVHRMVLEAQFGLSAPSRATVAALAAEEPRRLERIERQALTFAQKWFGIELASELEDLVVPEAA